MIFSSTGATSVLSSKVYLSGDSGLPNLLYTSFHCSSVAAFPGNDSSVLDSLNPVSELIFVFDNTDSVVK